MQRDDALMSQEPEGRGPAAPGPPHPPGLIAREPRLRVLYLASIVVAVFFLHHLWQIALLAAVQAALWLLVGLPLRRLLRQIGKLWGFALFLLASYALTAEDPAIDRWVRLPLPFTSATLALNAGGAALGALMILRVLAVVLASQVARAGDARAIAAGLGKLGVPPIVAMSIDAVFALLGGEGGRGGGGGGGGGGRGRRRQEGEPTDGFWASVKRLARGDIAPIVLRIERQIDRAESHALTVGAGARGRVLVHDVSVIAGLALTMLGIKALKILPSIPFAPGHKLVILTPLYIVASLLSKTRAGATLTGLVMGTVAFLLGDGRYGIFEILKHVAPGVICDLFLPLFLAGARKPGPIGWSLFGGLVALGRFATLFSITLSVQAPKMAWAILVPGLTVHVTFGIASGYVSFHLVRAVDRLRDRRRGAEPEPAEPEGSLPRKKDAT